MSLREIICEVFIENKKKVYTYLAIFGLISIYIGGGYVRNEHNTYLSVEKNYGIVCATENNLITDSQAEELGSSTYTQINAISRSMGTSIDPLTILVIEAVIACLAKISPDSWGEYATGLGVMNSNIAIGTIFLILLVCIIIKLLKSNNYTKINGLMIEDIENKIGLLVGPVLSVVLFLENQNVVQAAGFLDTKMDSFISPVISGVWAFMILVVSSVVYYIVRTVIYAGEVISVAFSGIPLTSFSIETVKGGLTIFLYVVAKEHPMLVIVLSSIIFIICAILFKKAYMVIRYFKSIYVRPLWRRKDRGLLEKKQIAQFASKEKISNVKVLLPMFAKTSFREKINKYDKCWLMIDDDIWVCKKRMFSKLPLCFELNRDNIRYFVNKNRRYFEIFVLDEKRENKIHYKFLPLKKKIHFVISREYKENYQQLENLLHMTDYDMWQRELKKQKKESKNKKIVSPV